MPRKSVRCRSTKTGRFIKCRRKSSKYAANLRLDAGGSCSRNKDCYSNMCFERKCL